MINNDTSIIEIIDLHSQELELIKRIRSKYKFAEITILTRNGLPFRIKSVINGEDLTIHDS